MTENIFFVILETFKVEEEESEYHLKICEYTLTNTSCFFIYIISSMAIFLWNIIVEATIFQVRKKSILQLEK